MLDELLNELDQEIRQAKLAYGVDQIDGEEYKAQSERLGQIRDYVTAFRDKVKADETAKTINGQSDPFERKLKRWQ